MADLGGHPTHLTIFALAKRNLQPAHRDAFSLANGRHPRPNAIKLSPLVSEVESGDFHFVGSFGCSSGAGLLFCAWCAQSVEQIREHGLGVECQQQSRQFMAQVFYHQRAI
ncbi:MAG: hypothetical protein RIR70_1119, partial [Pseudomonadota bacterium]